MISQNVCTYWCCMQRQKHILLSLSTLKWWQDINLWHRDAPKDISRVQSTAASSISKPNCCSQVVLIGSTQKSLIYQSVSSAIHRLTPWCRFFQRRHHFDGYRVKSFERSVSQLSKENTTMPKFLPITFSFFSPWSHRYVQACVLEFGVHDTL